MSERERCASSTGCGLEEAQGLDPRSAEHVLRRTREIADCLTPDLTRGAAPKELRALGTLSWLDA